MFNTTFLNVPLQVPWLGEQDQLTLSFNLNLYHEYTLRSGRIEDCLFPKVDGGGGDWFVFSLDILPSVVC